MITSDIYCINEQICYELIIDKITNVKTYFSIVNLYLLLNENLETFYNYTLSYDFQEESMYGHITKIDIKYSDNQIIKTVTDRLYNITQSDSISFNKKIYHHNRILKFFICYKGINNIIVKQYDTHGKQLYEINSNSITIFDNIKYPNKVRFKYIDVISYNLIYNVFNICLTLNNNCLIIDNKTIKISLIELEWKHSDEGIIKISNNNILYKLNGIKRNVYFNEIKCKLRYTPLNFISYDYNDKLVLYNKKFVLKGINVF